MTKRFLVALFITILSISQSFAAEFAIRCDDQKGYRGERYDLIIVETGYEAYLTKIFNDAYRQEYIVVRSSPAIRLKHLSLNESTVKLKLLATTDSYHNYIEKRVVPSHFYLKKYNVSRKGDMIVRPRERLSDSYIKNCRMLSDADCKKILERSKRNFSDLNDAVHDMK